MILWLLAVFLVAWEPLRLAGEVFSAAPTIGARGGSAVAELAAHACVAALAAAAGLSLINRNPLAARLAVAALIASALRSVQALYWSALPHDIAPGDELPLALAAVVHSAAWIVYLRWRAGASPAPTGP